MDKVSIGLRGWRFDETDVFDEDGCFKPVDRMPEDVRDRILRLPALVGAPCDACWLIHGDEQLQECNVAAVVYGEPMAEVVLCPEHEADFLYWYREAGGEQHRATEELRDAFHEWYLDGGRAPDGYEGLEHVDTDPEDLPDPPTESRMAPVVDDDGARIDLREGLDEHR